MRPGSPRAPKTGFSLIEMLVVTAVMATLGVASVPLLSSLRDAGTVRRAIFDVSLSLEQARTYAMAHGTYVRVALSGIPADATRSIPGTVVLVLYSTTGSSTDPMSDGTAWATLAKPLLIDNLELFSAAMNAVSPDTSSDATPDGASADGTPFTPFSRAVPGASAQPLSFSAMIQFNPRGEASVTSDQPARYIKIALDSPASAQSTQPLNRNPFILRLSGANGAISVLRKENM
jgi:prepilin-type N-terminal cleavage/methylation domain-containing protein